MLNQDAITVGHVKGHQHHRAADCKLTAKFIDVENISDVFYALEEKQRCQLDRALASASPLLEQREHLTSYIFGDWHGIRLNANYCGHVTETLVYSTSFYFCV